MMEFEYHNPVRLIVGRGKLAMVGKIAREHGGKALIVTSGSSSRTGLLGRVVDLLKQEGLGAVVYDKVSANPLTTMAEEAAALARREKCEVVIGLGGGSPMDCAKATAFMAVNDGAVSEYIYGKAGKGALPLILITTTAGTGSEGNCFAVLTNPVNNDKKALKSVHIYPKASIIDPELLATLPRHAVAGPGLDALFHAIEAYIARKANPINEAYSLRAISLLAEALPVVYDNPKNLDAWEKVVLANTLGGMTIDAAGTTLAHGLAHPVSGRFNTAHGETLACLFVRTMEFSCDAAQPKFAEIAKAMGEKIDGLSTAAAARKAIDRVKSLIARVGMDKSLGGLGLEAGHVDWLAENCVKTMKFSIDNTPRVANLEQIKGLYQQCL